MSSDKAWEKAAKLCPFCNWIGAHALDCAGERLTDHGCKLAIKALEPIK